MEGRASGRPRRGGLSRVGAGRADPRGGHAAAVTPRRRHVGGADPCRCALPVLRVFHRQIDARARLPGARQRRRRLGLLQHLRRCPEPEQHLQAQLPRDLRRVPAPASELHLARGGGVRGGGAPPARRQLRRRVRPPGDPDGARQEHRDLQRPAGAAAGPLRVADRRASQALHDRALRDPASCKPGATGREHHLARCLAREPPAPRDPVAGWAARRPGGRLLRAAAARAAGRARGGGLLRGRGRPAAGLALVHHRRGERR